MSELWERSVIDLAAGIAAGRTTSVAVVEAHIARIEAVNGALNAVVVRRYDAARDEARAADAAVAAGEPLGPLHGVPMTVKDSQDVAGLPSTYGIVSRANDVAPGDDPYVAALRAAGAIVLGKTNVPQLLIYVESDNPLHGRTNNPWDLERTCGGSSGGEGAIIAAGGSPLGIGTDIGGSLRAPAAFNGIVSLKPTQGRMDDPTRLKIYAGQRAIVSQAGPLARTVADAALAFAVMASVGRPDGAPALPPGDPSAIDVRGSRIGWYTAAGSLAASPAIERGVREAAAALEAAGATVVPFEPPRVDEAFDLFYGILAADGGASAFAVLGSDPQDPRVAQLFGIASKPRWFLALLERLLGATGQPTLQRLVRNFGRTDTRHYWRLVEAQIAYRAIFASAADAAPGGPLDAILCPANALVAYRHGASADIGTGGAYAPLYNVLGWPTGTVPFTRVRAGEETVRATSRDRVLEAARRTELGSAGLPVAVQVVARPWREDVALAVMAAVERAARERADFPATPVTPAKAGASARTAARV